jgi:hypothetical protein
MDNQNKICSVDDCIAIKHETMYVVLILSTHTIFSKIRGKKGQKQ